jgi:hypothetical protein
MSDEKKEEEQAISAGDLYLAAVLHEKKSKIADRKIHVGEFLYDHFGDLIGVYAGDGHITMPEEFK